MTGEEIKENSAENIKRSLVKLSDEKIKSRLAAHELWLSSEKVGLRAHFRNVDFEGFDFSEFSIIGAKFIRCSFKGVSFLNADLSRCNFSGSDFTGANLDGVTTDERTVGIDVER